MRGDDGQWHLFYTGTSRADNGKHQKLGHAMSGDLHDWARVGDGLILDRDDRYEEYHPDRWHDRAFRDPWVIRNPSGDGWLMYFTTRNAAVPGKLDAGAICLAISPDLFNWVLQDPVFTGGCGELEVPQVFAWDGTWYCLFCTAGRFWANGTSAVLGNPKTGTHYLMADNPLGPWRIAPRPFLDGSHPGQRYAARVVATDTGHHLLGFLMTDPATGTFPGIITDPAPLRRLGDGRLALVENM
ncbi:MAG: levansucrase [Pseudomonadota bacterium]